MIHIEDRYIDSEGTYNWDGALGDPNGLAVLAIFFKVDPKKPQVNTQMPFQCNTEYEINHFEK